MDVVTFVRLMKNKQRIYYLFYLMVALFPVNYLTTVQGQGFHYAADSLVNPLLLKEGGLVLCFDSLNMHMGKLYDNDAPVHTHLDIVM